MYIIFLIYSSKFYLQIFRTIKIEKYYRQNNFSYIVFSTLVISLTFLPHELLNIFLLKRYNSSIIDMIFYPKIWEVQIPRSLIVVLKTIPNIFQQKKNTQFG